MIFPRKLFFLCFLGTMVMDFGQNPGILLALSGKLRKYLFILPQLAGETAPASRFGTLGLQARRGGRESGPWCVVALCVLWQTHNLTLKMFCENYTRK